MKTIHYILVILFALFITSCSHDDNVTAKENKTNVHFEIKKNTSTSKPVDLVLTYGYYNRKDNKTTVNEVVLKDFDGYTTPAFATDQDFAFVTIKKLHDENQEVLILIDGYINNRVFTTIGNNTSMVNMNLDIQHYLKMMK